MASAVKEVVQYQLRGEKYKIQWKIPNWVKEHQSLEAAQRQKLTIESDQNSSIRFKWEFGFMKNPGLGKSVVIYCKLIDLQESADEVQYTLNLQVIRTDGTIYQDYMCESIFKIDECVNSAGKIYLPSNETQPTYAPYLDSKGALNLTVSLTIWKPHKVDMETENFSREDKFEKLFMEGIHANYAALLDDSSSADIKIVTRDGKELLAHKLILQAQCPGLASLVSSLCSNSTTGAANVDESEKTMQILLKFLYTGKLPPTWCDADTIVEFTWAAGKYRMMRVLQMLNDVLGTTDKAETSKFDLPLLQVANKLSLKKAEARLLKRVIKLNPKPNELLPATTF